MMTGVVLYIIFIYCVNDVTAAALSIYGEN